MIGTTFKLGFDGSSVARGLGGLSRTLGRVGGQIGIGMARQVGARMTDTLGRVLMAVPDALMETADWSGGLVDMAAQTGVAVDKLVVLEEALRLSGASANDTSRIISTLAKNLREAQTDGGPAAEALRKLGMSWGDFADLPVDQVFENIMRRLAELGPAFKDTETVVADLFGAKLGFKLIRFARDFDGSMKQAANNVTGLSGAMTTAAPRIDQFFDGLGRFESLKRSLASMALDEGMRLFGGPGGADRFFDGLNVEALRPKMTEIFNMLGRNLEVVLTQDLGQSLSDMFKNLGRSLAEGFKESFSVKDLLPKFSNPFSKSTAAAGDTSGLLREANQLLAQIRDKTGTAIWS